MESPNEQADLIISTHNHFDHFDKKAIQSLKKIGTVLICTEESEPEVPEDMSYNIIKPGISVKAKDIRVKGVHAYNIDKFREADTAYHPKGFSTGVLFELDGVKLYHASDTDPIQEMERLWEEDIDVVFLPIGGTYTMDQEEAIAAIQMIRPKKVVPIHYGHIDETTADIEKFKEDVKERTEAEPLVLE
jgi:L-ascorbate metabolism protein UlaG (beta-lactamase superfamily)